jgi:L-ascorbate metabolism protein UlaG (beta-lactamase superfamily)
MKTVIAIMAALFCVEVGAQTSANPSDVISTREGGDLRISFFGHGSIGFEYVGKHIYVDPVSDYADYSRLPAADLILVTHDHGDHLDTGAIEALYKEGTTGFGSRAAVEASGYEDYISEDLVMNHGDVKELPYVKVEAVPAYNTSPEKQNFHPKARLHNGYILTFGGTRVYVAGDSEDTPEMLVLRDIDIAFLPVNLPYTMTEEQAAHAVNTIKPTIFYPYHYGGTDHKTDLSKLEKLIEGSGAEMRIRPLE